MDPLRPVNPYERDGEPVTPVWRVGAPPEHLRDEQRREKRRPRRPPQPPAELPEGSEHVDTTA